MVTVDPTPDALLIDEEDQAWRFMGIRDDKHDSIHISVAESIIKTMIEPVHQKDVRLLP
jgi:hypothetical protein